MVRAEVQHYRQLQESARTPRPELVLGSLAPNITLGEPVSFEITEPLTTPPPSPALTVLAEAFIPADADDDDVPGANKALSTPSTPQQLSKTASSGFFSDDEEMPMIKSPGPNRRRRRSANGSNGNGSSKAMNGHGNGVHGLQEATLGSMAQRKGRRGSMERSAASPVFVRIIHLEE